jgi:hypothetical protein
MDRPDPAVAHDVTIAPDGESQYDRHPTRVGRRELLTVSTLGIGSLALPSATAAASGPSFVPSAVSYDGDVLVAAWLPFDSGADVYGGSGVPASASVDPLRLPAHLTQAGTTVSRSNSNPVDPEISALGTNGSFSEWKMRNSSSTLNLATSPHLQFTIGVNSGSLTLATLVLHSVRHMGTGGETALANLAAYVSTDGFVSSALRRTANLTVASSHRHIVINLGLSGQTFSDGQTVTVRIFPFAMPNSRDVRFGPYNSSPAPEPLDASVDGLNPTVVNAPIFAAGPNWIAGFVGKFTPPPPSEG